MKIILPVWFFGVSWFLTVTLELLDWAATYWILGNIPLGITLAHHQFCPIFCIPVNFWITPNLTMQCLTVGSRSPFQNLIQNLRIRGHCECNRLTTSSSPTDDKYFHEECSQFRKAMIEVGRSEKIIKEMDQLASEDHTHNATRAEINVYRGNWWIHSNVANFDSVPTKHQLDFKKALSTMYRLKQAEDEKQYAKWSQSSSSSSWQWQTNWWESDYEHSPQRWYDHWLNGVTRYFVANYSFAVWVSARIEFKNFIVNISVTADGSLLSPTGGVNTIHPAPEIHEHFMIQKATEHCAQPQAHFHLHWDHCD